MGSSIVTFQVGFEQVSAETGIIRDVSVIEAGEAKGHQMMVTAASLASAIEQLNNAKLPAYITHANAQGDRLTEEIGYFSEFYQDGDKIKARTFKAFDAFRRYKPKQYDALFEMASEMPENFGISLVFEARLFWELEDGDTEDYSGMMSRPDDSMYELPSVGMVSIQSADFVDNPAANSSLFSKPEIIMQTELTTAASDQIKKAEEQQASPEPPKKEEAKKTKKKKELSELESEVEVVSEEVEESQEIAEVAEASEAEESDERDEEIEALKTQVEELQTKIAALSSAIEGPEAVEEDFAAETPVQKSDKELREEEAAALMSSNKHLNFSQALLEVGKKKPELFNL